MFHVYYDFSKIKSMPRFRWRIENSYLNWLAGINIGFSHKNKLFAQPVYRPFVTVERRPGATYLEFPTSELTSWVVAFINRWPFVIFDMVGTRLEASDDD